MSTNKRAFRHNSNTLSVSKARKVAALGVLGLAAASLSACGIHEDSSQKPFPDQTSMTTLPPTSGSESSASSTPSSEASAQASACTVNGQTLSLGNSGVSCANAKDLVTNYLNRRDTEGSGNASVVTIGKWSCNTPTAAASSTTATSVECTNTNDQSVITLAQ